MVTSVSKCPRAETKPVQEQEPRVSRQWLGPKFLDDGVLGEGGDVGGREREG
ncbi:hypothetical protein RKD29_001178 [Streptomyces tendae]